MDHDPLCCAQQMRNLNMLRNVLCFFFIAIRHFVQLKVLTLSASFDGASWTYPAAILVPLPRHFFHRQLTHKNSILVLLNAKIFQASYDL